MLRSLGSTGIVGHLVDHKLRQFGRRDITVLIRIGLALERLVELDPDEMLLSGTSCLAPPEVRNCRNGRLVLAVMACGMERERSNRLPEKTGIEDKQDMLAFCLSRKGLHLLHANDQVLEADFIAVRTRAANGHDESHASAVSQLACLSMPSK